MMHWLKAYSLHLLQLLDFHWVVYMMNKKSAVILELVGTAGTESTPSERIFYKPPRIDSILLILVENGVKSEGNAALGESKFVDTVIGVKLEEDKVSVAC